LKDIARIETRRTQLRHLEHDRWQARHRHGVLSCSRGANALEVGAGPCAKRMAELKPGFPAGRGLRHFRSIPRAFVDASIKEVIWTIFEGRAAGGWAVVFVFPADLGARRLIPMIAVPVSLIGAFAGLWVVGFHDQHAHPVRAGSPRSASWWTTRSWCSKNVRAPDARGEHAPLSRRRSRRWTRSPARWWRSCSCLCAVFRAGRLPRRHRPASSTGSFAVTLHPSPW